MSAWPLLEPREVEAWRRSSLGFLVLISVLPVGYKGPGSPFPGPLPFRDQPGGLFSAGAFWFLQGSSHNIFFLPGPSPCPEPRCALDGHRSPASRTDMAPCFTSQERLGSGRPPAASLWNRSAWLPGWATRYLLPGSEIPAYATLPEPPMISSFHPLSSH